MTPAPALNPDDLYYDTMETTEEITRYVEGGYHPAIIGDILGELPQRQYRLMHKLGWGSYSTVWLAQTTDEVGTFVAVKITTAVCDNDTQVEMLHKATDASHVVNLLDYFKLHGPNGTHIVIVTEVVIPILSLPKKPPAWRKAAAYGVAQAMAELHARQVVHGDWHLGNIGIAMPQLAHQDSEDVMRSLSYPGITVVLTEAATKQTASLPAYLISPCNINEYFKKTGSSCSPQVKVFDFGSAHDIGAHPQKLQCAIGVRAPELVFAVMVEKVDNPAYDTSADVWALGATIYEIVTSSTLFYGVGMRGLPSHMFKLAGRIPSHWEKWSASLSGKPITEADGEEWWASRWQLLRKGCENDEDTDALVRLLKTVLVLDPAERPTAAQIINDPWFQSVSTANPTVL